MARNMGEWPGRGAGRGLRFVGVWVCEGKAIAGEARPGRPTGEGITAWLDERIYYGKALDRGFGIGWARRLPSNHSLKTAAKGCFRRS